MTGELLIAEASHKWNVNSQLSGLIQANEVTWVLFWSVTKPKQKKQKQKQKNYIGSLDLPLLALLSNNSLSREQ